MRGKEGAGAGSGREAAPIEAASGRTRPIYAATQAILKAACRIYFRTAAEGAGNVPATGPCLILSNHASFLDPVIVGAAAPREAHFLARTGILGWPVLGRLFARFYNTHPIRREGIDRAAIARCVEILRAGWALVIFPEGTRSRTGAVSRPRGGFGMILEQAEGTACVAAVVKGSARALGRGAMLPRPTKVTVSFGRPFGLERRSGEKRREFYERCADRLMEEWRSLGAEEEGAARS